MANRISHRMHGDMPTDERLIKALEPLTATLWAHLDRDMELKSLQVHQNRSGAVAYRMATDLGEVLLAELTGDREHLDVVIYHQRAELPAHIAFNEYAAEHGINAHIHHYTTP